MSVGAADTGLLRLLPETLPEDLLPLLEEILLSSGVKNSGFLREREELEEAEEDEDEEEHDEVEDDEDDDELVEDVVPWKIPDNRSELKQ